MSIIWRDEHEEAQRRQADAYEHSTARLVGPQKRQQVVRATFYLLAPWLALAAVYGLYVLLAWLLGVQGVEG